MALHRLGVHLNAEGFTLGDLGIDDGVVRSAYTLRAPVIVAVAGDAYKQPGMHGCRCQQGQRERGALRGANQRLFHDHFSTTSLCIGASLAISLFCW